MCKIFEKTILFIVCKFLFRVKYENVEILANYKKCMICPNHSRIFDPIFLYPKIENMYSVAKSDLFKHKFMSNFLTKYKAMPIKRGTVDIQGRKKILETLKNTEEIRLLIFPEGGIFKENYKENKRNTKNGAVNFSAQANVPIIPVYITSRPRFFSKVKVKFGKPIFPNLKVLEDKKVLKEEAKNLIYAIYDIGEKNA